MLRGADRVRARVEPDAPVAIFLIRHAEKATDDPRDPDLSDAGRARADALATMLGQARVSHLFATEFKRTQQTLAPLAARAKVAIEPVPAGRTDELLSKLRALPAGAVAVVAGHSNTIPAIAAALGGRLERLEASPHGEMLPDAEYGRLVLLLLPAPGSPDRAPIETLELHVGADSP